MAKTTRLQRIHETLRSVLIQVILWLAGFGHMITDVAIRCGETRAIIWNHEGQRLFNAENSVLLGGAMQHNIQYRQGAHTFELLLRISWANVNCKLIYLNLLLNINLFYTPTSIHILKNLKAGAHTYFTLDAYLTKEQTILKISLYIIFVFAYKT